MSKSQSWAHSLSSSVSDCVAQGHVLGGAAFFLDLLGHCCPYRCPVTCSKISGDSLVLGLSACSFVNPQNVFLGCRRVDNGKGMSDRQIAVATRGRHEDS